MEWSAAMRRRAFLAGGAGAGAIAVLATQSGCAPASPPPSPSPSTPPSAGDLDGAVAKLRAKYAGQFDAEYVDNVVLPSFLNSVFDGERPVLPMIDVALSKENALPYDMWGLLSLSWKPAPQDGVTVFLQGLEKRGPDNRRKRIYMSAVTPDLYQQMYQPKIVRFFDQLFDARNAGKPLMRIYLDTFWDLYWDLHLGVTGPDIPAQVRQLGESFNTVLAYRDPTQQIVYDNYMAVRKNLDFLKTWIDDRLNDIQSGKTAEPEKTFAWYWLKNSEDSEYFNHKDVVFECFHNFVAFSQWGNTLYNFMAKLGKDGGDAQAKDWFTKTMAGDYDRPDGGAFPPLERLVMEMFRTISPNAGSLSALTETRPPAFERYGFMMSPHTSTSFDPVQWANPEDFDPSRYLKAPTSQDIDEARIHQMGLAKCPFDLTTFDVKDGRKAALRNSGFGTVFAVVDDRPLPVCDYAGFAPFGFGYRRCPGEQLTIMAFEDLLRKTWNDKLTFVKIAGATTQVPLGPSTPEMVPIGPNTVITDDIGFTRPS
jgi:cytochrome P450